MRAMHGATLARGGTCCKWTEGTLQCSAKLDGARRLLLLQALLCAPLLLVCRGPAGSGAVPYIADPRMAPNHSLIASYICVGLAVATALIIIACIVYRKLCLPLRSCIRARQQVRAPNAAGHSRLSFQGPSPTFTYDASSRPQRRDPPPPYHACTAIIAPQNPPDNPDTPPPSYKDLTVQFSRVDSGVPGDGVARVSSSAALLPTAASGDTLEPED